MKSIFLIFLISFSFSDVQYNHPELNWRSFETKNFQIHFHEETEMTAREAATVAEEIYLPITELYDFEPKSKTHLILIDTDDYSNGAAYYYDNKIIIWASPLDFELRGSHRWLQNVITHEFAHIVSLQKSMKAGTSIPGAYLQLMNYETEKRPDVLYGYPNTLISYPIPGTNVPPWLAEGVAQYMYEGADWDKWDSHRDMILRDRVIHDKMLTLNEMNTFGKKGIGNESTYNAGFALSTFLANEFGPRVFKDIMESLSSPFQFSIDQAILNVTGESIETIYTRFQRSIAARYNSVIRPIELLRVDGDVIKSDGTTNIHPKWNPSKNGFAYLSNKSNDYFGQTSLYYYDLNNNLEKKIKSNVFSAPSWHSNGNIIFYAKKAKLPNKNGSRYYDIYYYDLDTDKEKRLTTDLRAFNPVYIDRDSLIAYTATYDGSQNLYTLNLKTNHSRKITSFDNRSMISHLSYDSSEHALYFDITNHHFRDIYKYRFSDENIMEVHNSDLYDERNMSSGPNLKVYAQDKSGIFNLYIINRDSNAEGYITNVTGGAFMPDISKDGRILYSLYEDGKYRIAIIDEIVNVSDDYVGYGKDYFLINKNSAKPITKLDSTKSVVYMDKFPNMFIMPKIMLDYNTWKPGFYFSSSEIINRLSLFGGASINKLNDVDLFFIFDFKRFYSTVFFETYYLTRNTKDESLYQGTYPINDDIKFRLVQFRSGLKVPFYGSMLEISGNRQWYRAFIQEQVLTNEYGVLQAGAAYDYFRGWSINTNWNLNMVKKGLHSTINPSGGFSINADINFEKNDFIEGLNLSDSGTLTEEFKPNNLIRLKLNGIYHFKIPFLKKQTVSVRGDIGLVSNSNVDSFFHFYLGGLTGIKGYPFYSIQGTKNLLLDLNYRIPIFSEKHYKFNWIILQNSTIGVVAQMGNAWTKELSNLKKSLGIQWRINGFSFYNFPTAIEVEYHQPLVKFERVINEEKFYYGDEGRTYVKVLFDF
tara:strand:- start:4234 stop:7182 length:2949 start_codon:yes stop_codon:yes gene_type:complete